MLPLGATLKLRLGVINTAKFRLTVTAGIGGEVFQRLHSNLLPPGVASLYPPGWHPFSAKPKGMVTLNNQHDLLMDIK